MKPWFVCIVAAGFAHGVPPPVPPPARPPERDVPGPSRARSGRARPRRAPLPNESGPRAGGGSPVARERHSCAAAGTSRTWSSSRSSSSTCVYVSAVTESERCPTRAPVSAQVSPCRCQRLMRRWRRSCGDQVGVPDALHARTIAVRSRSCVRPGKTGWSAARSSRGASVGGRGDDDQGAEGRRPRTCLADGRVTKIYRR